MRIWNLISCVCCCSTWASGCCVWLCTLSVCGLSVQHLEKRNGLWLILVILVFCWTPFLCIAGVLNWIFAIPKMIDKCKYFLDTADAVQGFHDLVIPDQPGEGAQKCFNFLDQVCKT